MPTLTNPLDLLFRNLFFELNGLTDRGGWS
jgi:hypothetical protein